MALSGQGWEESFPPQRLGDSGVRWSWNGLPRLSTRAVGFGLAAKPSSRGAGSGGGQDPGQVGDGGGEIELGGGLVTPRGPVLRPHRGGGADRPYRAPPQSGKSAGAHGARHLARGTGAGTRRQVDLEILLGEVGLGRPFGHFGDQGAPGVGKLLAGVAIPHRSHRRWFL